MPIYLQMDGLKGNASSSKYQGYMNVSSYSWSFGVPMSTSGGSASNRQSPGKVEVHELHVVKKQDSTTATLMSKAFGGSKFNTANLVVTLMQDGVEQEVCRYDMSSVILSNYHSSGAEDGGNPTESLSLNFAKITISQTSSDASLVASGPVRASWDIGQQAGA